MQPNCAAHRAIQRPLRRGITLLEVLFSIFVLAVGLLGLAALVPIGKIQVSDATQADASVTIGRSALYDLMIRDMTDEVFWCTRTGSAPSPAVADDESFVLDPMSLSINSSLSSYDQFPPGTAGFPKLRRLTLLEEEGGSTAMRRAIAERIFVYYEPTFFTPPDDDLRPTMINPGADGAYGVAGVDDDSNGVVDDISEGLWSGSDDLLYTPKADYSWLVTITPRGDGRHNVSVVVFYKRDFIVQDSSGSYTPDSSERIVQVSLNGGGDVDLIVPSGDGNAPNTVSTADQARAYLKVRANQWILVSGQSGGNDIHRWYRVVNVSDLQNTAAPYYVSATLAGPDAPTFTDVNGSIPGTQVYATICDGVIGVYERAVKLDEPSLWTGH